MIRKDPGSASTPATVPRASSRLPQPLQWGEDSSEARLEAVAFPAWLFGDFQISNIDSELILDEQQCFVERIATGIQHRQFGWGGEGFLWAIWLLGSEPTIKHIYKNVYRYKPAVSQCEVADEKVTSATGSAGESCGVQRS